MPSIQDSSIGIAKESTYGTPVTVTRWYEFTEESLGWDPSRKQGTGLRVGGRVARSNRRVTTTAQGSGGFGLEMLSKGMGLLFEAAFGTGVSTVSAGALYQQNFTLSDNPSSLTIQKGLLTVDDAGASTVVPYTYNGCMVSSLEINVPNAEVATAKVEFDIRDLVTATAYTAPTMPTGGSLFHFGQASVKVGGTVVAPTTTALATGGTAVTNVRDFTFSMNNNLSSDRFNMGATALGRKKKPIPGLRELSGTITVENSDVVLRDAFLNDTPVPIVLDLTSTEVVAAGVAAFQLVLAECKIDGDLPTANGTELGTTSYKYTVLDNGVAANPVVAVLRTSDTAL